MTRVSYIGQTRNVKFAPWDGDNFFATHRLESDIVGYIYRIDALVNANVNVPVVPSSGFLDGTACTQGMECDSQICYTERCVRA
jgi:hypothetical protein